MRGGDDGRPFDGRYRLLGPLGTGGMATVYLAEDESLGRKVAIKILADRYAEDEQFVERFRREARSAAGLNHPNIVQIYDRGQAEGTYYIAMEHLEGRSLKDIIGAEAPLKPDRAIDITLQILQALRFAHAHGVVHRDIKPHNIILATDGRPKVTDFGIARAGAASQMTEVGSIIGTAQYLSPEQARGQPVQPQADLYSLGVVLYEMLTGHVPFEGDSAVAIAFKHVSEPPAPPSELNPLVPPALEQVVMRALAKDPARRYASADEMAADLERVRRGLAPAAETQAFTEVIADPLPVVAAATAVAPPPTAATRVYTPAPAAARADEWEPPPPAAPPPRRRRPLWPWFLVLGLLAAAGAIAAVAIGGLSSDSSTTGSTTATVPTGLVGKTYDQAKADLAAQGLTAQRHDVYAQQQPGIVIQVEHPAEGSTVQRNTTGAPQGLEGARPGSGAQCHRGVGRPGEVDAGGEGLQGRCGRDAGQQPAGRHGGQPGSDGRPVRGQGDDRAHLPLPGPAAGHGAGRARTEPVGRPGRAHPGRSEVQRHPAAQRQRERR